MGSPEPIEPAANGAVTRPRQMRLPSERVVHLSDEVVDAVKRGDRRAWEAAYDTYGKG